MTERRIHRLFPLLLVALLLVAGCAGKATPQPATQVPAPTSTLAPTSAPAQPTATAQPEPTATPAAKATSAPATTTGGKGASPADKPITLQDVQKSVVRIEASGSFRYPEGMKMNSASGGTGFVIDPSGLAVTNNHVVTGAALLKVYVAGEQEPRHAKVLGVSECSDLALIQIEGGNLPALKWYEQTISPGLDVYAAGYPLGNPEFTLTRGIVSKARADGKTNWASVPSVIEHDASLNPGNSGGPLVTKDGEVVGINYASASETRQYYAIARSEAEKVLSQLKQGKDVDAIGLNGEAFVSDDGQTSGVWIYSVKSGSPADKAGMQPGDILTKLEGVVLATDGTMGDYCDILRSHNASDTFNVQVVRFDTSEVLEGQINGRELKVTATLPSEPANGGQQTNSNQGQAPAGFTIVSDDTGTMTLQVPDTWTDVSTGKWTENDQKVGIQVSAAPDLQAWADAYDTNGIFAGVSRSMAEKYTPAELLDDTTFKNDCTYAGRNDYKDDENVLKGFVDLYKNCDGGTTQLIEIAAAPADNSYIVLIQVTAVTDADMKTLDNVIYKVNATKLP